MSLEIKNSNSIIAKGINLNLICIYLNLFHLGTLGRSTLGLRKAWVLVWR